MTSKKNLKDGIYVVGAREHNLKNISLFIPRNQITVLTGLSGSGKSSLVFDTVYAEGQRRYVESLSSYARNFLDSLKRPDVDGISGLSPAIAIDQKSVSSNPRSTVGTVTEIYDFLRLLFARVGAPHCPEHGLPVSSRTPEEIFKEIERWKDGTAFYVLAPMAQGKKGEFLKEFRSWAKKGFLKARVDGKMVDLEKATKLAKTKAHDVDLVVDQLIMKNTLKGRLMESLHRALSMAQGTVIIETLQGERKHFSIHASCSQCGFSFPELEPRFFSFNNPRGACTFCKGLGTLDLQEVEIEKGSEGSVGKVQKNIYTKKDASSSLKKKKDEEEESDEFVLTDCPHCLGKRLKPEVLSVDFHGKNIANLSNLSARDLKLWLEKIRIAESKNPVVFQILEQIEERLQYLVDVGTGYLSLDRSSNTLSGGEAQRIRLASQVGSALRGVLYVMDEPSIGLHPRDHQRMLKIIGNLKDRGNTILLVEHDEETILFSDRVVDMGPGAGRLGGAIMAEGTPAELQKNSKSLTGKYLSGEMRIPLPLKRRSGNGKFLHLKGAVGNNLKEIHLKIPLGLLVGITGVSGSGKSTLIMDTLYRILSQHFYKSQIPPAKYGSIQGLEHIDKVIDINQKPIGRTPRSTPSTYTGLFPMIRDLFAQLPEAQLRGLTPGHFSFNVKGGRCESCQGQGLMKVEMHFLSDVYVECDSCAGKRYNAQILGIAYRGKSIADVLEMTVEEAFDFFKNHSSLLRKLETLLRVGLGYMTLGQSSTTLSGGEAQRVKLSKELSRRSTGKTLYILDEPTTGLHFEDIRKLMELLHDLTDQGNTVLVIEHQVDVICNMDWLFDMGPEGGNEGGYLVAEGIPEEVAKSKRSLTGPFLKERLSRV